MYVSFFQNIQCEDELNLQANRNISASIRNGMYYNSNLLILIIHANGSDIFR